MKMNPEIKAQWIAALRGGEYKQAKSVLCQVDTNGAMSYCCLGVLSDLAAKAGVGTWGPAVEGGAREWLSEGEDAWSVKTYMSEDVAEWSGVPFDGAMGSLVHGEDTLSALNDNGYTFAAIADIIEKNL